MPVQCGVDLLPEFISHRNPTTVSTPTERQVATSNNLATSPSSYVGGQANGFCLKNTQRDNVTNNNYNDYLYLKKAMRSMIYFTAVLAVKVRNYTINILGQ